MPDDLNQPISEEAQDLADLEDSGEESSEEASDEDSDESQEAGEEETGESDEEESDDDGTDEEDGESEGEIDEEEPIGDKPEEREYATHLPVKAIKAKYPNLFKDFPQLRTAFFEHPKYTEIFPDVESARDAASKAADFDNLEAHLVDRGDPKIIIQSLSENNPKALRKVVENLPNSVREVDNQLYINALATPIIEELLYHANAHATKTGNKNLGLAARHISNFVFANGGDIPDISRRDNRPKEPSEAERQLDHERAVHAREKYDAALSDVVESVSSEMDRILGAKLDDVSPFERRQIIKESRVEIDRLLKADKSFMQTMRGLWKRATDSGYSDESKSRIRRAWLDRARLIAPQVRNKLRQEALGAKKVSKKAKGEDEQEGQIKVKVTSQKRQFPEKSGRTSDGRRTVLDPKKIDWRRTSDMDILNSK